MLLFSLLDFCHFFGSQFASKPVVIYSAQDNHNAACKTWNTTLSKCQGTWYDFSLNLRFLGVVIFFHKLIFIEYLYIFSFLILNKHWFSIMKRL